MHTNAHTHTNMHTHTHTHTYVHTCTQTHTHTHTHAHTLSLSLNVSHWSFLLSCNLPAVICKGLLVGMDCDQHTEFGIHGIKDSRKNFALLCAWGFTARKMLSLGMRCESREVTCVFVVVWGFDFVCWIDSGNWRRRSIDGRKLAWLEGDNDAVIHLVN